MNYMLQIYSGDASSAWEGLSEEEQNAVMGEYAGIYQTAGALEAMTVNGCSRMTDVHLVEGAGHWVQQERAAEVTGLLLDFLRKTRASEIR